MSQQNRVRKLDVNCAVGCGPGANIYRGEAMANYP